MVKRMGISAEPTHHNTADVAKRLPKIPKSDMDKEFLYQCLKNNQFFEKLSEDQIYMLIDCMNKRKLQAGVKIIKEQSEGKHLYILQDGSVEIHTEAHGLVANLGAGKIFGELALLYNCKRTATVISKENCILFELNRHYFKIVITMTTVDRDLEKLKLVRNVKKLSHLSTSKMKKIVDCLEEEHFAEGDCIIKEGASGDLFYIIESGSVIVTKNVDSKKEEQVAILKEGDYFGEVALQSEDKRTANVYANQAVKEFFLRRVRRQTE